MRATFAVVFAVFLVAAASAAATDRVVERGIIQAIDRQSVVLRALDGTEVSVALGPATRFRLNGRDVAFRAIRVGFVAEAVLEGSGPAVVLRAFGTSARVVSGVLTRVRPAAVVVRRASGGTVRVPVTGATTVWRNGVRLRLRALRRGMAVEVERAADGSASTIRVLGQG